MTPTRIKICGITREKDAEAAAIAGADAVGLVFYPPSPRHIDTRRAAAIVAALPPFVTVVGLFVDAPTAEVAAVLEAVPLDTLQFHGDESPEYCAAFHRPWIKALRMKPGLDVALESARYSAARAVLVDSWREGVPGGTGETFDWQRLPVRVSRPVVLAGGLDADNVGRAVRQVRPAAVDVSGGVESAPGIKDAGKIASFVAAVRAAEVETGGR